MLDSVIASDLHLGADNCEADRIVGFFNDILHGRIKTKRLILNGDIFDSSHIGILSKSHWMVLSLLRKISKKIEVIWICGNHDPFVEFLALLMGTEIGDEYIFETGDISVLVLHGHQFDRFIDRHPLLTSIGDTLYGLLQRFDKSHRLARFAKQKSKTFIRCAEQIEKGAVNYAKEQGCKVAICGHTHHAEEKEIGDIWYYNSGCWTEKPCHYLTVKDGKVKLKTYEI